MNQGSHTLRQRLVILRWALPIAFAGMAVLYQFGFARSVQHSHGELAHFVVEIVFYGTSGPLVAFWALTLIRHWLDEKECAEKQARAIERRLASITAASADAILSLAPTGQIESWNLGAELLFGYSAEEMRGRRITDLFGDGEAAEVECRKLTETVQQAGFVRGHEATCRDARGGRIAVELTATHLTDEAGQSLGLSVILRDITRRKRREQEICQLNASLNEQVAERTYELAEKVDELARVNEDLQKLDQMRSEFVALVSHQIRAPLTNMRGAVERMQMNCKAANPICARMLNIVNQQTGRLERLVQKVLNAARLEAGELTLYPEPTSLLPVVGQTVAQMRARTIDRPFRLSSERPLPLVFADRDRVAEILANLLDNADKYSPPGQEVIIGMQRGEAEVILSVRDGGPGLKSHDLERVFDRFYRADSSDSQAAYGYGLGLYVCRCLVETHGGRIWAENAPDGGAVFSFTLPLAGDNHVQNNRFAH